MVNFNEMLKVEILFPESFKMEKLFPHNIFGNNVKYSPLNIALLRLQLKPAQKQKTTKYFELLDID